MYPFIPATTAAAASASTAATGWSLPCPVRPSGTPASSSSRSQRPSGTGRETMAAAGAGTAAGMADLPTRRLRWLGSVKRTPVPTGASSHPMARHAAHDQIATSRYES